MVPTVKQFLSISKGTRKSRPFYTDAIGGSDPHEIGSGILTALVFSLMLPTILNSLNNHVKL